MINEIYISFEDLHQVNPDELDELEFDDRDTRELRREWMMEQFYDDYMQGRC